MSTHEAGGIPTAEYRRKQRVLCQYVAHYRYGGSTRTEQDALVVVVEFSDQIEDAFLRAAQKKLSERPIELRLVSYLPEGGRAVF